MSSIAEMIGLPIMPEPKARHDPTRELMEAQIQVEGLKPHSKYEIDVFNFLFEKRKLLKIARVERFTALLVDGAIELEGDGRRLTVEVKYRMNWEKACQAEWQFRNYKRRNPDKVDGGLVIFEQFSGDWQRKQGARLLENGWSHWYRGHAEVDIQRLDLLRLQGTKLENFEDAMRDARHLRTSES